MRVGHQRGRLSEHPILFGDDQAALGADGVDVPGQLVEPLGLHEVRIGTGVARGLQVPRLSLGRGQEDQRHLGTQRAVEVHEVLQLEALDVHRRVRVVQVRRTQLLDQTLLHGQPEAVEVGGVLDLRDDAGLAPGLGREPLAQLEHLGEGSHLELAVVAGVAGALGGDALDRAERLELGQREVLGEPAGELDAVDGLGGPTVGELRVVGDIRGPGDLVLVAADQDAVPGADEVGLEEVGPHPHGQLVGLERVLGPVPGGPAVADDPRLLGGEHGVRGLGARRAVTAGGGGGGGGHEGQSGSGQEEGGDRAR